MSLLGGVRARAKLTRQRVVFNDTFSGTSVNQGAMKVDLPLGSHAPISSSVTASSSGSSAVLVLQSSKGGQTVFRDDAEILNLR